MVHIMTAMLKADDHTCLSVYIKSRQKAITALLQTASATGVGAVPAGAEQHRQIQECGATPAVMGSLVVFPLCLPQKLYPTNMNCSI